MEYIAQYLLLRPGFGRSRNIHGSLRHLLGLGCDNGIWRTEPCRFVPAVWDGCKNLYGKTWKTTELVNCGIIKMETSWNILGGRNGRGCWNLMQWLQLVQQLNVVIQLQLCRHEQILNPTHFCFCRPNNLGKNIGVPISCFLGSLKDLALYTTSSLDQQNCFISTVDTCISGWNSSTMTERFRQDGSLYQRMAQDYGSFPPFWDG